jgi:hypothetical protein
MPVDVKNPLRELIAAGQSQQCWELLAPIFSHPAIHAISERYGCVFDDVQSDVFLNLINCQPRKPITNLGGWLFANAMGYARRNATRLKNERVLQGEYRDE